MTTSEPVPAEPFTDAEAALSSGDWRRARQLFEAALDVDPAEAHLGMATALWCGYEIPASLDHMRIAYRLFVASGRPARAAWVAGWLGAEEAAARGNVNVGRGWFRRASRLLEEVETCPEHGWCWVWGAALESDPHALVEASARALELARAFRDGELEALCLAVRGLGLVLSGEVAEGMSWLDEAMASALSGVIRTPVVVSDCLCMMLTACEQTRDYGRAEEWCRIAQETAAARSIGFLAATCRVVYGWLLGQLGRSREAEAELWRAVRTFEAGHRSLRLDALARLADLQRRQGRLEDCRRLLREAAGAAGAEQVEAELALDTGDHEQALALARRLAHRARGGAVTERAVALQLLVRAASVRGELAEAEGALPELEAACASIGTSAALASCRLARAVLAEARGAAGEGADACREALQLYLQAGAVSEAARCRIVLAGLLRQLGRAQEAAAEEKRGREVLDDRARSGAGSELTPRELEILRLVAGGLSNRSIADHLSLSPHTVHRHVANLLRKLEVPTRAAAAAEAARLHLL